jgi:Skp family chaperone for outer membrane proteins
MIKEELEIIHEIKLLPLNSELYRVKYYELLKLQGEKEDLVEEYEKAYLNALVDERNTLLSLAELACEDLRMEKGLSIILDSNSSIMLSFDSNFDLTDELISKLKRKEMQEKRN